jgi:arylsulfatase A-like enzyme
VKENDLDDVPMIAKVIAGRKHTDNYGRVKAEWSHQAIVDSALWKANIRAYLASITYADAQIGRVLDAWNNSEYAENSIIVLWGDHGWHLGEKQHWSKRTLWETGTRTPMIFASQKHFDAGITCETPVNLMDIFPTLIGLCDLPYRSDLDGLSLVPLMKNPDIPWDRAAVTIWGQNNVSVRTKDWRYIHYCDESKELYNHKTDPNEWNNLATDPQYMPVINQLHRWVPDCVEPSPSRRGSWFEKEGVACE